MQRDSTKFRSRNFFPLYTTAEKKIEKPRSSCKWAACFCERERHLMHTIEETERRKERGFCFIKIKPPTSLCTFQVQESELKQDKQGQKGTHPYGLSLGSKRLKTSSFERE